jgi:hypothetical protein
MPLHLGPRWHAFVHGLFRSKDEVETRQLYQQVRSLFHGYELHVEGAREELTVQISDSVLLSLELPRDHSQARPITRLVSRLLDYENMFLLPDIDWTERRSVAEWWDLRNSLSYQRQLMQEFQTTKDILVALLADVLLPILDSCPTLAGDDSNQDDISVRSKLVDNVADLGTVVEHIMAKILNEDIVESGLFSRLSKKLESNLIVASGGNPGDPRGFSRAPKPPTKSDIKSPNELVATYLRASPLFDFFQQDIEFSIPTSSRFEHHHIVAGSGHGKTQTLQYLIGRDLEAVKAGNRTIIVLDSQGDLIRNIANLAEFAPGGPLHEKVVIIDPTDVEWPVSLNLFDVGIDRLKDYDPLERERLTNSILELYDFVLGTLLSAEMTQKQNVIFRYVTRLMLHIPNATIHTLRELMEPGSQEKFAPDIEKLTGSARHFFETEFSSREFEQTKKQVLRRLWGILENQTFERMFSHPRSKLDLFSEMNAGKVILINTAKDLLKEQGTEIFGRFFIAMIAQAAQERATLPKHDRIPTIVYIDEAADYFDRNIGIILAQARKYNVGMVLAHQYLGQLEPRLQEAFGANTSIKFAGGVSAKDARTLAPMLYCEPGFIEAQSKGCFAVHIRGVTKSAVPLTFPFGFLEQMPQMNPSDKVILKSRMRQLYAVHHSELDGGPQFQSKPSQEHQQPQSGDDKREPNQQSAADKSSETDAGFEL